MTLLLTSTQKKQTEKKYRQEAEEASKQLVDLQEHMAHKQLLHDTGNPLCVTLTLVSNPNGFIELEQLHKQLEQQKKGMSKVEQSNSQLKDQLDKLKAQEAIALSEMERELKKERSSQKKKKASLVSALSIQTAVLTPTDTL